MNTMRDKLIFRVRTLSIEEGFELSGDGFLQHPQGPMRLIEAIVRATQIADHREATIEIFDCTGILVETIDLNGPEHVRITPRHHEPWHLAA